MTCGIRSGPQQRLDCTPFIHGAVALGDLRERQREIEYFSWVDCSLQNQVDEVWHVATHWCGTSVQMGVREEKLSAVELNAMRHSDVTDVSARPCSLECLPHRFLRSDTLEHRVCANATGKLANPRRAFVATLGDDIRRS